MLRYVFIIILFSCAVYANTLNNDFVSDDIPTIVQRQDLGNVFRYADVSSAASSLDYLIGGRRPPVYHITNIILHAAVSALVFYFLRLFFAAAPSFWGALVFAVHPAHSEAVAWVSGRPYLFLALFVLAAFLLYVKATENRDCFVGLRPPRNDDTIRHCEERFLRRSNLIVFSLVAFTLALFSWVSALLFPAMVILYDVTFQRWRRTWKLWPWFFIPVAFKLFLMKTMVSQRVIEVSMDTGTTVLTNPVYNFAYSFFAHLGILLWPAKLTLYREPMVISLFWLRVELLALVCLFLCLPLIYKLAKPLFFALCVYALFLSPTYSPVTICWLVAERYLYLPSVAFSMLVAFVVQSLRGSQTVIARHEVPKQSRFSEIASSGFALLAMACAKFGARNDGLARFLIEKSRKSVIIKYGLYIFLSALVAAYSARTLVRNRDWQTHASIWRATVAASPASPKAHLNMGDVWSLEGDLEKSAAEFMLAARLKPDYAEAYHNLANIYYKMGRLDEAIENYRRAATLKPSLWQSYQDMGIIYYQKGDLSSARECFRKSVEINPGNADLQNSLRELERMTRK